MGKKENSANDTNGDISMTDVKVERPSYEDLLPMMNVIAKPLASKKTTKKIE